MGDQQRGLARPQSVEQPENILGLPLRRRRIRRGVEQMINGIVRRLESLGDSDIASDTIGEIVMESLARIDTVAYVRFASVYKNFQEVADFEDFVSELRPPKPPKG